MYFNVKSVPTAWVRLYLSGPIEVAKQTCRQFCLQQGLCVTVSPTQFIYTGGEEAGYVVGLVNYPRFPTTPTALMKVAEDLAVRLLAETAQHSVLIETGHETKWASRRAHDDR